jgi:hypothetical protein
MHKCERLGLARTVCISAHYCKILCLCIALAKNTCCTCFGMARAVYICTVYDRILGDFPAKNTVFIGLARTVYLHRI